MRLRETILFEKCPLCGQAGISMEKPKGFVFSKPKINRCPRCFAEFVARGVDKFQLVFCEPRKIIGGHSCKDRVFRGCYLGYTLSKSEWETIASRGESSELEKFRDMGVRFRRGSLPTCPSEGLPFSPERGEIVHYVSSPVYLDDQKPSKEKGSDKGDLFLTSKRIVYKSPSKAFVIALENVERVEESPPGFLVKEKDSFEPRYFFPPLYDPVLDAVFGTIHNFKEKP